MTIEEIAEFYDKTWVGDPINFSMVSDYCDLQEEITKKETLEKVCDWLRGHARWFGHAESDGFKASYHYDAEALVQNLMSEFGKNN